jgi:two-component system alkaline phosphatase synthesis response regulator PhoP
VSPAEPSQPLRVLLVEDHPDLAEVTAEFLQAEGLDVQTAMSGREALEVATAFGPDIVLCDLNLPDMSGLDVIRGLRSNPSTKEAYAVILTAMRERELSSRSDVDELCVDAFISKPITIEAIRTLADKLAPRPVQ